MYFTPSDWSMICTNQRDVILSCIGFGCGGTSCLLGLRKSWTDFSCCEPNCLCFFCNLPEKLVLNQIQGCCTPPLGLQTCIEKQCIEVLRQVDCYLRVVPSAHRGLPRNRKLHGGRCWDCCWRKAKKKVLLRLNLCRLGRWGDHWGVNDRGGGVTNFNVLLRCCSQQAVEDYSCQVYRNCPKRVILRTLRTP